MKCLDLIFGQVRLLLECKQQQLSRQAKSKACGEASRIAVGEGGRARPGAATEAKKGPFVYMCMCATLACTTDILVATQHLNLLVPNHVAGVPTIHHLPCLDLLLDCHGSRRHDMAHHSRLSHYLIPLVKQYKQWSTRGSATQALPSLPPSSTAQAHHVDPPKHSRLCIFPPHSFTAHTPWRPTSAAGP